MQKTLIEWVKNPDNKTQGFTWNPITGCLNHVNGLCKGGGFPCYAYKLANGRLKQRYLANENFYVTTPWGDALARRDPFYPRFWPERLNDFGRPDAYGQQIVRNPKGIFVCDMGELFGEWIPIGWQEEVFGLIKGYPEHRFYLLTKQPQNLSKFSPFPENCWVGVTATTQKAHNEAVVALTGIEAKIKFISHEPLLEHISLHSPYSPEDAYDWDIIGACTGTLEDIKKLLMKYPDLTPMPYGKIWTAQPKVEWLEGIEQSARKANIPIFEKDNLKPLLQRELIQELPK